MNKQDMKDFLENMFVKAQSVDRDSNPDVYFTNAATNRLRKRMICSQYESENAFRIMGAATIDLSGCNIEEDKEWLDKMAIEFADAAFTNFQYWVRKYGDCAFGVAMSKGMTLTLSS